MKRRLPTLSKKLKTRSKHAAIGVTQGGSSRTRGAKPAATSGQSRAANSGEKDASSP